MPLEKFRFRFKCIHRSLNYGSQIKFAFDAVSFHPILMAFHQSCTRWAIKELLQITVNNCKIEEALASLIGRGRSIYFQLSQCITEAQSMYKLCECVCVCERISLSVTVTIDKTSICAMIE